MNGGKQVFDTVIGRYRQSVMSEGTQSDEATPSDRFGDASAELVLPKEFAFRSSGIDDRSIKSVCEAIEDDCTCVPSSIDLSDNDISSAGLRTFGDQLLALPDHKLEFLRYLRLDFNRIDEHGALVLVDILEKLPKLTALSLAHNEISSQGVHTLSTFLKTRPNLLSYLNLEDNCLQSEGVSSVISLGLLQSKGLKLNIGSNDFEVETARYVSSIIASKECNFLSLNLSGCDIGDEGVNVIAEGLWSNSRLARLNLARNRMSFAGIGRLLRSVSRHPALQVLILDGNDATRHFGSFESEDEEGSFFHIREFLKENTSVRDLRMNDCMLTNVGAQEIADGIVCNHTLVRLELSNNNIAQTALFWLFDGIAENVSLEQINIVGNVEDDDLQVEDAINILQRYRPNLRIVKDRMVVQQDFDICFWSPSARSSFIMSDSDAKSARSVIHAHVPQ